MRVLMLTHRLPFPPDRGDRIRSYHLLKSLAGQCDLSLACVDDQPATREQIDTLRDMVSQLAVLPLHRGMCKLRGVAALIQGRPITPAWHFRARLADTILQWHRRQPFDAVLTFCTGMVEYAKLLPQARQVLDLVDVDSLKWRDYAANTAAPLRWVYAAEAKRLSRIESGRDFHFDAVTVISAPEADAYRKHIRNEANLHVVPNGVDLDYFHPLPPSAEPVLTFVGVLDYKPNVDAMCWFCQYVWPQVRRERPEATLRIVGRNPTDKVIKLGDQAGVTVVGPVDDVRDELGRAAVVIAPLQLARGVQNKVLEAMASARTVVCSDQAATGIDATNGEHFCIANESGQWVNRIGELLNDPVRRESIAAAGRGFVQTHFNWDQCLSPMIKLLASSPI